MSKIIQLTLISLGLLSLFSCNDKMDIQISIPDDIKFIGHKGSGPIDKNGNINLLENTWDAIANAMNNLDGSEIDIQMSADSTIWVFHDHEVLNCKDSLINFFLCSDIELKQISKCNYRNELIQLSSFLSKSKSQNWKNKILSLDLKVLYNPQVNQAFESQVELMTFLGNKLQILFKDSQFDVLFEVFKEPEYAYFNHIFQGKVYRVDYSPSLPFIQKMNEGHIKLSLPIYELADSFVDQGINIENLWTINTANQFIKSLPYKPQLLESDNIPLMTFFKSIQNGNTLKCKSSDEYPINLKNEEFYTLDSVDLPTNQNILFHFETINDTFPEGVLFTFTAFSEDGETKDWNWIYLSEFSKGYYFLNSEYLQYLGAEKVKISIWNRDKKDLDYKLRLLKLVID